jgi:hypothetical protein
MKLGLFETVRVMVCCMKRLKRFAQQCLMHMKLGLFEGVGDERRLN